MTDFFNSLKTDLMDGRMRMLLAALVAALIAAVAYAALGAGGSSAPTPGAAPAVSGAGASGIAASAAAANPNEAVAEVTSGAVDQRHGFAHDPFALVPGVVAKNNTSSSAASVTASRSSGSGTSQSAQAQTSSSSKSSGATSSTPAPAPTRHQAAPRHETVYKVSAELGAVPAGALPQSAQLTPYENLRLHQKLPSTQQQLLSFNGVTKGGHRASFKLIAETIPRGPGVCVPSATQCEAIALKPGEVEELEYVQAGAAPVLYELRLLHIEARKGSASATQAATVRARVARRLLDAAGQSHSPEAVVLVGEEPVAPSIDALVVLPQAR